MVSSCVRVTHLAESEMRREAHAHVNNLLHIDLVLIVNTSVECDPKKGATCGVTPSGNNLLRGCCRFIFYSILIGFKYTAKVQQSQAEIKYSRKNQYTNSLKYVYFICACKRLNC